MKITVVTPYPVKTVKPWEMEVGDIGTIRNEVAAFFKHTVLRTYSGLISLDNPMYTWKFDNEIGAPEGLNIELLSEGSTVTISVEKEVK
jgi:hypothetical protein